MDTLDKKILNRIQGDFPICRRPYAVLADELNSKEEEIYRRVEKLIKNNIIRHLGGTFDYKKLNLVGSLVATKVEPKHIEHVASKVNQLVGVTHNYKRNNKFNLWFSLTAPSKKEIEKIIEDLKREKGVISLLNLPTKKSFKLKVDFSFNED